MTELRFFLSCQKFFWLSFMFLSCGRDTGYLYRQNPVQVEDATNPLPLQLIVSNPAPTCSLEAVPNTIRIGESLTLKLKPSLGVKSASIDSVSVEGPLWEFPITPRTRGDFTSLGRVVNQAGQGTCSAVYHVRENCFSKTEEFQFPVKPPKLDLVWIVDNSGSMSGFIDQVRKNFQAFVEQLNTTFDLKLILVSKPDGVLGLSLPSSAKNAVQINSEVDSYNPFLYAVSAVCGKVSPAGFYPDRRNNDNYAFEEFDFCGSWRMVYMVATPRVSRNFFLGNQVYPLFRPGANRSFVIVSDDNDYHDVSDIFFQIARDQGLKPKVFGFVGLPSSTCKPANVGNSYIKAAQASEAAVFDICQNDWSPNFSKLTEMLPVDLNITVTLAKDPQGGAVEVLLDQVSLPKNLYSLQGNQIRILKPLDSTVEHKVRVQYKACDL